MKRSLRQEMELESRTIILMIDPVLLFWLQLCIEGANVWLFLVVRPVV